MINAIDRIISTIDMNTSYLLCKALINTYTLYYILKLYSIHTNHD